jgi:hypothetical protein
MEMLAKEGCGCGELTNRLADGTVQGFLLKPMNCPHHIQHLSLRSPTATATCRSASPNSARSIAGSKSVS